MAEATPNMNTELDVRDKSDLDTSLAIVDSVLRRTYLQNCTTIYPSEIYSPDDKNFMQLSRDLSDTVRFEQISKIVFNKKENQRDKLVSVYKSIANLNSSLLLVIEGNVEKVNFYVGTKCAKNVSDIDTVLKNNLEGHFQGTETSIDKNNTFADEILTQMNSEVYISGVSAIPALRTEKEDKENQFVQGIEKFIDTMRGKKYTMLLIADSKTKADNEYSRHALENLYTQVMPFCESTYTYGDNESQAINHSLSQGVTHLINQSLSNTITHTIGVSDSETITNTKTSGKNISHSIGSSSGISFMGINASSNESTSVGAFSSLSHSEGSSHGTSSSTSRGETTTNGTSDAKSTTHSEGTTNTSGSNRSLQIKFENHYIKKLLERIDNQLKRYDLCADLGMWNCAAYFMGETPDIPVIAATSYQSLICGKNSSLENDYVINWDKEKASFVKPFLMHFEHPLFENITPGTLVSSAELAIQANLPNHSVPGLPVLECAEFGRNISSYNLPAQNNSKLNLGKIFHMNHQEELDVELDAKSLTSHVFITGSTGSGKSNTIYQIVSEARRLGKKFLVIEPAKGEYKNIFGKDTDVQVLGTNPNLTKLLRLNPFSFDSEHILVHEHIDRLISIFNVCWPMYAAMPAVLKEAVEKSYADAGWDLSNPYAQNKFDNTYFPTFADVARNIRIIIDSSEYDAENKGAYKGSLLTRLTSLTNGINGMIFSTKEIGDKKLFDENTIIDLSRIGSAETKSLIMGILVLKLQEYRMSSGKMNSDLNHLTVLEEAHNLLKKTSSDTSSESGNLQGRSVEMISNAIAEMRTYGEGFIIADQAPGLLDMSVIRNTNTKIIMRLPDFDDRELVGKAANLNDDQIVELAKLPCGVAAVYQNEWVEAVLCKIEKYESKEESFIEKELSETDDVKQRIKVASLLSTCEKLSKEAALKELSVLDISGSEKAKAVSLLQNPPAEPRMTKIGPVMSAFYPNTYHAAKNAFIHYKGTASVWTEETQNALMLEINQRNLQDQLRKDIIQSIITDVVYNEAASSGQLLEWQNKGGLR